MYRPLTLAVAASWAAISVTPAGCPAVTGDARSIEVVGRMIEAHGGLDKWQNAPTVSFTDELVPAGASAGLKGTTTVEQGQRRAYIEYPDMNMRMAWDGDKAWGENWAVPYPPRFLALLNYYFLNLPWLALDTGVVLGPPETRTLWEDPVEYIAIRMEFEPGVGDTPEDYYVLYIHPENHLLKGCEYVVTYNALLPEGVKSSPPHILVFDRYQTVEGLVVPVHYTIYEVDHGEYARCGVEGWSFSRPFDPEMVKMPPGAVVDTSTP
jgi:hypothetical protein